MQSKALLFLDDNKSESEFFNLPDEEVITLRELLDTYKVLDSNFQSMVSDDLERIQTKLDWVTGIAFNCCAFSDETIHFPTIYLSTSDNDRLIIKYNKKSNQFEDIARGIPKIYQLSPRVRLHIKRQKDLPSIQSELGMVQSVGFNIYKDSLRFIESVSGNFTICYRPDSGLSVLSGYDLVASFRCDNGKPKDRPYLNSEERDKLLDTLLFRVSDIPKNNLEAKLFPHAKKIESDGTARVRE